MTRPVNDGAGSGQELGKVVFWISVGKPEPGVLPRYGARLNMDELMRAPRLRPVRCTPAQLCLGVLGPCLPLI